MRCPHSLALLDLAGQHRRTELQNLLHLRGGLLFADKEEEPGSRISDVRFKQLQATGANTVVTACPFCSIMLKGAQASAQADTQFVDLMTYVKDRL
jgi:Fe-S oxidoreductase